MFERRTVSCTGIRHAGEWFEACQKAIEPLTAVREGAMVELIFTDIDEEAAVLFQQATETEWLYALRDSFEGMEPFVWIQHIHFKYATVLPSAKHALLQPVFETMESWTEEEWRDVLKDLYEHPRHMNILEPLTVEQFEEIQEKAQLRLQIELANRK